MFSELNIYKQELLYDWNIKGKKPSRDAFAKTKSGFLWNVKFKYLFNRGFECRGILPNKMQNSMSKIGHFFQFSNTLSIIPIDTSLCPPTCFRSYSEIHEFLTVPDVQSPAPGGLPPLLSLIQDF